MKDYLIIARKILEGTKYKASAEHVKAIKFLDHCLDEEGLNVSKIVLSGSQVKGKTTEDSDIDVVIISDDFQDKDIFERARLTKKLR